MTAEAVDSAATYARISRTVNALRAARGYDTKTLASLAGMSEDTLSRRLKGKPWKVDEILAVAQALDVSPGVILETDPDDWFRGPAETAPSHSVAMASESAATRRVASGYGLEFPQSGRMALSSAAA